MKFEEAMKALREVCALYRGTLKEHEMLLKALEVVGDKKIKKDEKTK